MHEKKEKDDKAKKAARETKSLQMFFKPNKIAKPSGSNAPTSYQDQPEHHLPS